MQKQAGLRAHVQYIWILPAAAPRRAAPHRTRVNFVSAANILALLSSILGLDVRPASRFRFQGYLVLYVEKSFCLCKSGLILENRFLLRRIGNLISFQFFFFSFNVWINSATSAKYLWN